MWEPTWEDTFESINDTTVSSQPEAADIASAPGAAREWLLLTHQLPTEPAYFRVKVHRRLERIGAVALKASVYVLPPGEDTQEDFEWLCAEIARNGGETSLCVASFLDGATDERLVAAFREARAADYRSLVDAVERDRAEWEEGTMGEDGRARLARHRQRLAAITEIDFFEAPEREAAVRALDRAERVLRGDTAATDSGAEPRPVGRTWVTRRGVKVDRIASAWLIERFIDPAAEFRFVPARGYVPEEGVLRFDMFEGEYTHVGDACTFEVLLERFDLDDAALTAIGEIVHDIDCKDEKFGRAEAGGFAAVVRGLVASVTADEERIARAGPILDALYESFRVGGA